jgi:hypothetical protein
MNLIKSCRNCESCNVYRALFPESTCQYCWNSRPGNVIYNNPKVPDPIKSYRNCDSCNIYRARIPETTCENCWKSKMICIREGCYNKVNVKNCYCNTCTREQLYNSKCEKVNCEVRVYPGNRYCREHT